MKKRILFVIIALFIGILPIIFNEIKNKDKYSLARDGKKLYRYVLNYVNDNDVKYEEILINDSLKLGDKTYNIDGNGFIFITEDNISFMLSRDNMCVLKLDYLDSISFQEYECPTYRMFNGIKEKIVTEGNGLYKENDKYVYKGKANNYIMYEDSLCKIDSFTDTMNINCDGIYYSFDNDTIIEDGIGTLSNPFIIE